MFRYMCVLPLKNSPYMGLCFKPIVAYRVCGMLTQLPYLWIILLLVNSMLNVSWLNLFYLFILFLFYFIFKLYNIVLILPNIYMNPPQVYTCSPSWTLLPPPSPYHPSGSSQCTSPKHPVSCIKPGLATRFIYDIIHVSMPFSQIFPPSPSPTVSKRLFYTSVSFAVSYMGLLLPSF